MTSTPTPDTDCNRVAFWPQYPTVTHRCTQPEGHTPSCWILGVEVLNPQHRAPVPTETDPFDIRPRGGKHRAREPYIGAASGPNHVDSDLRRRLAQVRA